jgi:hypothetical protein
MPPRPFVGEFHELCSERPSRKPAIDVVLRICAFACISRRTCSSCWSEATNRAAAYPARATATAAIAIVLRRAFTDES